MPVFEDVTRALVRELNPRGDLTPLDSLIDFKRFHPFCLVLRKRKSTLFWGARYVHTDYTLLDVLEPGSSPSGQPLTQSCEARASHPDHREDSQALPTDMVRGHQAQSSLWGC